MWIPSQWTFITTHSPFIGDSSRYVSLGVLGAEECEEKPIQGGLGMDVLDLLKRALIACARVVTIGAAIQEPVREKLVKDLQRICDSELFCRAFAQLNAWCES
jgi:hypothetical protein